MLTSLLGETNALFIAGSEAKPKSKPQDTTDGVFLGSILVIGVSNICSNGTFVYRFVVQGGSIQFFLKNSEVCVSAFLMFYNLIDADKEACLHFMAFSCTFRLSLGYIALAMETHKELIALLQKFALVIKCKKSKKIFF